MTEYKNYPFLRFHVLLSGFMMMAMWLTILYLGGSISHEVSTIETVILNGIFLSTFLLFIGFGLLVDYFIKKVPKEDLYKDSDVRYALLGLYTPQLINLIMILYLT